MPEDRLHGPDVGDSHKAGRKSMPEHVGPHGPPYGLEADGLEDSLYGAVGDSLGSGSCPEEIDVGIDWVGDWVVKDVAR